MHSTNNICANELEQYDVLIIGGGIHGCAAAADAAQRGLKVLLVEQYDLASCTSSASSKLIHGGLRYLEQYEFAMVYEAIHARSNLLKYAAHLVKPLEFVLPNQPYIRSSLRIALGLKIYDFMDRLSVLPASKSINRHHLPELFNSLNEKFEHGFYYYDAYTQDARLTIETALLAQQSGAYILTRAKMINAKSHQNSWDVTIELQNKHKKITTIRTKSIINTSGSWVNHVHAKLGLIEYPQASFIQGSHIVVPKIYSGNHAYILQSQDNRVIFCIPYFNHTMIGTTDVFTRKLQYPYQISNDETKYLCDTASMYFKKPINPNSIIHSWSGVRTLKMQQARDAAKCSRNKNIFYNTELAPVVSLYGGKLTTHRSTAITMIDKLKTHFPKLQPSRLTSSYLPGSVLHEHCSLQDYANNTKLNYPWLPKHLLNRYLATYGSQTNKILINCKSMLDLGEAITNDLYEKEIDYLCTNEWAQTAEDILWRRTSLGLTTSEKQKQALISKLNMRYHV